MSKPITNDFSPHGSHSADKYQSNKPASTPITKPSAENANPTELLTQQLPRREFTPADKGLAKLTGFMGSTNSSMPKVIVDSRGVSYAPDAQSPRVMVPWSSFAGIDRKSIDPRVETPYASVLSSSPFAHGLQEGPEDCYETVIKPESANGSPHVVFRLPREYVGIEDGTTVWDTVQKYYLTWERLSRVTVHPDFQEGDSRVERHLNAVKDAVYNKARGLARPFSTPINQSAQQSYSAITSWTLPTTPLHGGLSRAIFLTVFTLLAAPISLMLLIAQLFIPGGILAFLTLGAIIGGIRTWIEYFQPHFITVYADGLEVKDASTGQLTRIYWEQAKSIHPQGNLVKILTLVKAPKSSGSVQKNILVPRVKSMSNGETSLLFQRLQELSTSEKEPF